MADTGAVPVITARAPSLSGEEKAADMVCRSLMARPSCSAGRSSLNSYQGSSRTLLAPMSPWRTPR